LQTYDKTQNNQTKQRSEAIAITKLSVCLYRIIHRYIRLRAVTESTHKKYKLKKQAQ